MTEHSLMPLDEVRPEATLHAAKTPPPSAHTDGAARTCTAEATCRARTVGVTMTLHAASTLHARYNVSIV